MDFSYWEYKTWLSNVDFTIIGSGIVGLNSALRIHQKFPKAKILILERGVFPNGASTKNAGFACFGSISEILDDLETHSQEEVLDLVQKRRNGLQLLRNNLGDSNIDYHRNGGYELFTKTDFNLYENCISKISDINSLLTPVFKDDVFLETKNTFCFKNIQPHYIVNQFEGQIDTGKMMSALLQKVQTSGVKILNNCIVEDLIENPNTVEIKTNHFTFSSNKVLIATNGFASQFGIQNVKPARAQVVITKPIEGLNIKGTFHLDKGYYYFRNIDNRILFGGGRNLDFKAEETTKQGQTELVQQELEKILKETILPGTTFEIEYRWSGIMGVGSQKKSIVKQVSNNIFCGVRLGGMGIAIGSQVGMELADLL
ncbi:FAD-binding oxidoreductase [Aquimarina sp. MMG015]|uniref:NAD(P)/FAD-dependent oxidoreductase n=1 Tax=unclassified Aquimarina TaxID=2627091 RepID=UPI000E50A280|nr:MULTISPECIES: FAD-dependent oxidoreductase [unclassified Aquimarina]AXT57118.1 FAD-binding oxidoreductase [Aquimarina sp. AD1]MBQ4801615.1 FAD-binding oxidoreductase [Aquimarina sp. MMG015]RKN37125.1 FAD-dependent oxidoreductase [Aquimarina sp. AD1]